jgi:c-di-GMP-binding flagellar brake protein YcgR
MAEYVVKVNAKDVIRPGMPLVIDFEDKKGEKLKLKSSVQDTYFDRGMLKIAMPSYQGRFLPLPRGEFIRMTVIADKVVYAFSSRVLDYGRDQESNLLVMYVTVPEQVDRVQRRRYVRIPLVLNGSFTIENEEGRYSFLTRDFSAGGMLMCTSKFLKVGQIIYVELDLTDLRLSNQKSQIVRYVGLNQTTGFHEYGVQFLDVPRELEKALVCYVFQQEIKLRKLREEV